LLALLYDWHNHLCLEAQNADLDYLTAWIKHYSGSRVLVGGCGTGRVAAALCRAGFQVTGVDIDPHRLARAALADPNLEVVEADLCFFSSSSRFDVTILPYSVIQLVPPGHALKSLASSIAAVSSHHVIVDVSDHFAQKVSHDWRVTLDAPCHELNARVVELQKVDRHVDHLQLFVRYLFDECRIELMEKWYFHEDDYLRSVFTDAGMTLRRFERGYGDDQTTHRRIYHFQVNLCEREPLAK